MKQIPNAITLLNLLLGCLAIMFTLQDTYQWVEDANQLSGYRVELQRSRLFMASLCIALAAAADFLDGLAARLLGAQGDMGKQLDSLADVVSFGVAPSFIVYQFLRLGLAAEGDGLTASEWWLLPAFIPALAAAWRLARFNIDSGTPSHYFRGTPVPSAGITLAALPLIWWQANTQWEIDVLTNTWVLYGVVLAIGGLMVSNIPIMSNKPAQKNLRGFVPHISVAITGFLSALFLGWWAVPVTFAAFVVFSIIFNKSIVQ